jgi:hypothetical protein
MSIEEKELILQAWDYCDTEDKSTEFMLQYMSDVSGVDYDEVVDYIASPRSRLDREEYHENKK